MRLTRGEGWWLMRRREGITQEGMAFDLGISVDKLRAWELDRAPAPLPARCGRMRDPLTPGELAALCRRRKGITAEFLAVEILGLSATTVKRMERDRTRTAGALAAYWYRRGLPRARAAAPLNFGEPSKTVCRSREDRGGRRNGPAG